MQLKALLFPTKDELLELMPLIREGCQKVPDADGPGTLFRLLLTGRVLIFSLYKSLPQAFFLAQIMDKDLVILLAFSKAGTGATKQLAKFVESWAKEHGLTRLVGYTKRRPEAFARAYGWKFDSYKIVKEIGNGI